MDSGFTFFNNWLSFFIRQLSKRLWQLHSLSDNKIDLAIIKFRIISQIHGVTCDCVRIRVYIRWILSCH